MLDLGNRITAGFSVMQVVVTLLPSASPVLQKMVSSPTVALSSIMACRVFRDLRLAALRQTEIGAFATMRSVHIESTGVNVPRLKSDDATADTDFRLEEV
jgi:hypothetical protein